MKHLKYIFFVLLFLSACEEEILPSLPTFSEITVTELSSYSAKISGAITDLGNQVIEDHGFILTKDSTHQSNDDMIALGSIGRQTPVPVSMDKKIENLQPNTEYFIFPFVLINGEVITGKAKQIKTPNIIQPGIKTVGSNNISYYTAQISGSVITPGTFEASEYGLVWSDKDKPTIEENTKYKLTTKITNYPTNFTTNIKDLLSNTTYYFRAYVISNGVISYGENLSFTTKEVFQPSIHTGEATNIQVYSAKLSGQISKAGSFAISERGIVWNTSNNPTTQNNKAALSGNVTSFPNNYTIDANNLKENTTYYYRAYIISNGVVSYGENKTFKTPNIFQPEITTEQASDITPISAKLSGKIVSAGTFAITEKGIAWGTAANPTTNNTKKSISGDITKFPDNFTIDATSLSANTTYHYRAYVISNGVTTYGADKTFNTPNIIQPGIVTGTVSDITATSATLQGVINYAGTFAISERGVVWATSSNPTTSNNKSSISGNVGTFPNQYTVNANNLSPNTKYYYRAFVIAQGITTYGEEKTFQTPNIIQPGIRTDNPSNIGGYNARLNGTLTSGGSKNISEYGFVYGNSANPTTSNSKISLYDNPSTFPKSYSLDLNNINSATTYHVRAYVIMDGAVSYGENKSFTTSVINPVVETGGANKIAGRGVIFAGTVQSSGSYAISEMGIVYSTSNNPTTANSKQSKSGSGISYPHDYNFLFSSLPNGTIYYRAYCISNGQVFYGSTATFVNSYPPTLSTGSQSYLALTGQVNITGIINSDGSPSIKEYGIVYAVGSSSITPTTGNNKLSSSVSGGISTPLTFTKTVNGSLLGNCKTVYYRTYAITTDNNVHYATEVKSFSSPTCIK